MPAYVPPPRGSTFMADLFGVPIAPISNRINMLDYRPNTLGGQPYRFRQALQTGNIMLGTALSIPHPAVARLQASLNFDYVFIDAEHTPMGPDLLKEMITTTNLASEGTCSTVVRLPTHGAEWIAWALDAGASAIVLPHTETAGQTKAAVANSRFAPLGHRSYPPFATVPGHTDGVPKDGMTMMNVYNDNAAVIPQIESVLGVENCEEICATPGVDAIMIGTADLRMSMGLMPGMTGDEPEFEKALQRIQAAAEKHNLPILGFAMGPLVQERLQRGWKILMLSADYLAMVVGQTSVLKEVRAVVAEHEKQLPPAPATNGISA